MKKYYAIYDTKENKYFCLYEIVRGLTKEARWSALDLAARWFASKLAAKIVIKHNNDLKSNPNLCIKEIALFE